MQEEGFVQLPLYVYDELRGAFLELQAIKASNYGIEITKDYHDEPQMQVVVKNENMKAAFEKVKDQYPEFEFKYSGDTYESIYGAIKKIPVASEQEEL